MAKKLSVYQRIVRAADNGTGLRLSADDCWELRCDDAIVQVAIHHDEADRDSLADAAKGVQGG